MDQYHIYAQISKGREVTSYKARKKKSIGYVTARSYEKRLLSRVRNAVLLINDMVHPNVVKFHNWYETRNHIWVVEEYCVGGNLRTVRSQDAYEPETSVRRFGVDLMAGLRYVHGRGIIHCDLKPSRILVNEYGVLKLTGFDIARRVTETKGRNQRGSTPHYMAPELIREKNDPPYSYKSDLWALGCILYEMYFGEPPFVAGTISDLNKSIVYDAPRFEHVQESRRRSRGKQTKSSSIKQPPSKHFMSLLCCLLEKNVTKRIDWDTLLKHSFWTQNNESRSAVEAIANDATKLPREPAFESFVMRINQVSSSNSKGNDYVTAQENNNNKIKEQTRDRDFKHLDDNNDNVDSVIRLLRDYGGISQSSSKKNEKKKRYVTTPSTVESPALMRKKKENCDSSSSIKKRPQTYQSKRRKSALERLESLNRKRNVVTAPPKQQQNKKTFKCPSWNLLFRRDSDINIRPIVGNRNIERTHSIVQPTFTKLTSDFTRHSISDLGEMISQELDNEYKKDKKSSELEVFFHDVLFSLDEGSSATRGNVLSYLVRLMSPERTSVHVTSFANIVLNSSLLTCFDSLLNRNMAVVNTHRLVRLLGLLVRHATLLPSVDTRSTLRRIISSHKILRHESVKVRRATVALLGELVFFTCTQNDEDEVGKKEEEDDVQTKSIVGTTEISRLVWFLRIDEDSTVRHYAAKTISNVLGRHCETRLSSIKTNMSREIVRKLVTSDVAMLLLDLCAATKISNSIRSTAMSGLTYILWIAPTITSRLFDRKNAFRIIVLDGLLRDGGLHVQRNALNILNVVLSDVSVYEGKNSKNSVSQTRMRQNIVEHHGYIVLERVSKILETHTNEVVRAKAALSMSLLLIRRHDLMIRACVKHHLPAVLTGTYNFVGDHRRFASKKTSEDANSDDDDDDDNDDVSYLRRSVECLVSVVADLSARFTNVALHLHHRNESKYDEESFRYDLDGKRSPRRARRTGRRNINDDATNIDSILSRLEFLIPVATSPRLREVAFSSLSMIRAVGSLLKLAFAASNKDSEFRRFMLLLLEALVRQPRSPLMQKNIKLAQTVLEDWLPSLCELLGSNDGNHRELSIRLLSSIVTSCLGTNSTNVTTAAIVNIWKLASPHIRSLMKDTAPLPQHSLRFMSAICLPLTRVVFVSPSSPRRRKENYKTFSFISSLVRGGERSIMKHVEFFWISEQRQGRWCGAAKMFAQELCLSCEAELRCNDNGDDDDDDIERKQNLRKCVYIVLESVRRVLLEGSVHDDDGDNDSGLSSIAERLSRLCVVDNVKGDAG